MVSKQHGRGPETMFRAYTAWTEGAPESEITVIKTAMGLGDQSLPANNGRGASAIARLATEIGTTTQAKCLTATEKLVEAAGIER